MKMRCICKHDFKINDVLVGKKNDVLNIVDAKPCENESIEDVKGYCDIRNLTTNEVFGATWSEAEDYEALTDIFWLED